MNYLLIVLTVIAVNLTLNTSMMSYQMIKRWNQIRLKRLEEKLFPGGQMPREKRPCPGCERKRKQQEMLNQPSINVPPNPNGVPYPIEVPTVGEVIKAGQTTSQDQVHTD